MKVNPQILERLSIKNRSTGIALVITLILLSIITFMTVTFLVLSQRERGSVSTTTDATAARFAADAALARAEAQILAPIMALTNDQAYDAMVSTNYINAFGFNPTIHSNVAANVNYDFETNGNVLTVLDLMQNISDLLLDPRAPVYMQTNPLLPGRELRFYLDLNRNGRFETNGWAPVITGIAATPTFDTNGNMVAPASFAPPNVLSNYFIGDPEWIGQLEHPDQFHSATNRFTSRIAFFVVPESKTLDINHIDNQAYFDPANPFGTSDAVIPGSTEEFLRNQGMGTWEINLAAFFADLNTNQWNNRSSPYFYRRVLDPTVANSGVAFDDAMAIKSYRYKGNRTTLASIDALYGNVGDAAVQNDGLDEYANGPLQLTPAMTNDDDLITHSWPGADNTNHFFTTQELWDPAKTSANFTNRLSAPPPIGFGQNSYDRYTYYRLLSQMGTESAPERGKLNINYVNIDAAGNIIPQLTTNFLPWAPTHFFTNAARMMLNSYFAGVTNGPVIYAQDFCATNLQIEIYPTNQYTPAVHRLLQVAANIYDSTFNRIDFSGQTSAFLPTVFRPLFFRDANANVFIVGYTNESDASGWDLQTVEATELPIGLTTHENVYGVPWVLGAKKGLPNFNDYGLQTPLAVTRKLLFEKPTPAGTVNKITQMYLFRMTNNVYADAWNSYPTVYPRNVQIRFTNEISVYMEDANFPGVTTLAGRYNMGGITNIPAWPGLPTGAAPPTKSFIPFNASVLVTNATYNQTTRSFVPETGVYDPNAANLFPVPAWRLSITNRIRFCIVDSPGPNERILDYVNLEKAEVGIDVMKLLRTDANGNEQTCNPDPALATEEEFWCTNRVNGLGDADQTWGIKNQITGSEVIGYVPVGQWSAWQEGTVVVSPSVSIPLFNNFLKGDVGTNKMQAPFTPTGRRFGYTILGANDPLVHYSIGDLTVKLNTGQSWTEVLPSKIAFSSPALKQVINSRYFPWGRIGDPFIFDTRLKDPLVSQSIYWDFPTNFLPNVGWLGRVHRGTPWQTVYLKSSDITAQNLTDWGNWTGDTNAVDARLLAPTNDWRLFDLFTTAINDNATRGQMSVNQSGLAAWAAVLSGVIVLNNNLPDDSLSTPPQFLYAWTNIQPAGAYSAGNLSPLATIVQGINRTRAGTTPAGTNIFPDKLFSHVGDILATPELTEKSPFLNTSTAQQLDLGISDEAYERIPQQIMSLLTLSHTPRFVIYSFGQALRPADHSIVMSGQFFGLCTNYQVTAETATRTVIRIENAPRPGSTNTTPRIVVESYNILPPD